MIWNSIGHGDIWRWIREESFSGRNDLMQIQNNELYCASDWVWLRDDWFLHRMIECGDETTNFLVEVIDRDFRMIIPLNTFWHCDPTIKCGIFKKCVNLWLFGPDVCEMQVNLLALDSTWGYVEMWRGECLYSEFEMAHNAQWVSQLISLSILCLWSVCLPQYSRITNIPLPVMIFCLSTVSLLMTEDFSDPWDSLLYSIHLLLSGKFVQTRPREIFIQITSSNLREINQFHFSVPNVLIDNSVWSETDHVLILAFNNTGCPEGERADN
jgi:hypothetical protein